MVLSASQQWVIFGYNALFKEFLWDAQSIKLFQTDMFHVILTKKIVRLKYVLHEWGCFFNLKRLQTECFD